MISGVKQLLEDLQPDPPDITAQELELFETFKARYEQTFGQGNRGE